MSARAREWHLVGHATDPVPPSSHDITVIASDFRARRDTMSGIADTLRGLTNLEGWSGKAAESFVDKADKLLGDLDKMHDRYDSAASAMQWWSGAIDEARTSTGTAVGNAEEAHDRLVKAQAQVVSYTDPTPDQVTEQQQVANRISDARRDLNNASAALRTAIDNLDDDAKHAAGLIDKAADIWDDGTWGNFKGWLRKGAALVEVVCKVLEVIGAILGAVILVLALVASAPAWLLIAAVVAGVALLAGHLFLMYVDEGDVTKKTIALDVANIALSALGLKGAGTALKDMTRFVPGLATRLGSAERLATEIRLSRGQMRLYENALQYARPGGALSAWASQIRNEANIAEIVTKTNTEALTTMKPGALATLLHQDRELAQISKLASSLKKLPLAFDEAGVVRLAHQKMVGAQISTIAGNALWAKDLPHVPDNVRDIANYLHQHPIHLPHLADPIVAPVWRLGSVS